MSRGEDGEREDRLAHSEEIQKVAEIEAANVTDTKGKTFNTKFVAPVAAGREL